MAFAVYLERQKAFSRAAEMYEEGVLRRAAPLETLRQKEREFQGRMVPFFAIPYRDYYIWGATAGMLVNLYRYLAGPPEAA